MSIIIWLLIGLGAGALAKMITPQKEKDGWLTSLGIGLLGSMVGGFVFGLLGIQSSSMIGSFIAALLGALLVLFIYHKFIAPRMR